MSANSQNRTDSGSLPGGVQRVGRYLLFPAFAHGGMASVHFASFSDDGGFAKLVAAKRVNPIFASSDAHLAMLRDEARVTARIRSPNVVAALEVVREGDHLLLVMEYVHGISLARLRDLATAAGKRLPVAVVSAIMVDALRGLHAAHVATGPSGNPLGIVHRDVSPQNILVGADGVARVLDFGIAKALGKEHVTVSGELKGKLGYMSPEQLLGLPTTRQTDLYAAGVILWELLCGAPFREKEEPARVMMLVAAGERPAVPSTLVREIDPELDDVVMRALDREPSARFATAEVMAEALEAACRPAPRGEVREVLDELAHEELETLARLARQAETMTPSEIETRAPVVADVTKTRTVPRKRSLAVWAGLPIAIAAVAGIAWSATRAPAPAIQAPPAPVAAPRPPEPPAPVASAAAIVTEEPAIAAAPDARAPTAAAPKPKAAPFASSKPAPRQDDPCVPPYRFDEKGKKRYKPECLN